MTVTCVITIRIGVSVRAAMLNRASSRQQKAIAKNRKTAGMRMALEITTNGALSPGLSFENAGKLAAAQDVLAI